MTGNDVKTLICRLALAGETEVLARYLKLSRSEKRVHWWSYVYDFEHKGQGGEFMYSAAQGWFKVRR